MSKLFASTSETHLPDNFLDPLTSLNLQINLIPEEEPEEPSKKAGKNNNLVNIF